jgi:hypothetical protein
MPRSVRRLPARCLALFAASLMVFTLLVAAPAPSEASETSFRDVPARSTFFTDIYWLVQAGITNGCQQGRFCPDQTVTRAQMAAFLVRALDLRENSSPRFDDVSSSHTFAGDIGRLATSGITTGCGSNRFCPDQTITRGQMAAFLVRALDLRENSSPRFDDVSSAHTFAEDIGRLATSGVTTGCGPDRFCPDRTVTRGQMAAFLRRALGPDDEVKVPETAIAPSDWDRSLIGVRSWYEANTGPRDLDESKLRVHEGRLNLTTNGMTLENVRVNGPLHVVGDDITVRNVVVNGSLELRHSNGALVEDVIVRSSGIYPVRASDATNWVLQYAEVDGRRSPTNNGGLYGGNGKIRYSEFHSHTDSAKVGSNSVWEYNWLHTNSTWGTDAHVDGLQSMGASNVVVRGNYIDMPISHDANSAIIAQSNFGAIRNWTVKDNYLNGGNFTVYFRNKGHGDPQNIVIEDNRIGRDYRYGLLSTDGNGITTSGNVWHDTGAATM